MNANVKAAAAQKTVRELKNLRTTDSKKVASHSHCCRCCRGR